jgi:hypothetical protein
MKDLKPKMKSYLLFLEEDLHRLLKVESAKTGKDMGLIIKESLRKTLK